jgi:hypothetical protein
VNRVILTHDKTLVRGDVLIDDKPGITGNMIPAWKHLVFDSPTTAPSRKLLGFGSGRTGKLPSIPSWRWPLPRRFPAQSPWKPHRKVRLLPCPVSPARKLGGCFYAHDQLSAFQTAPISLLLTWEAHFLRIPSSAPITPEKAKLPPFGSHVITLVSGGRYRSSGYHMR